MSARQKVFLAISVFPARALCAQSARPHVQHRPTALVDLGFPVAVHARANRSLTGSKAVALRACAQP